MAGSRVFSLLCYYENFARESGRLKIPSVGGVARSDSGRAAPGWGSGMNTHPEAFGFCPSQETSEV